MVSHLTPNVITTSTMGLNQTWTCQAYGDGVIIYTWYKNDKVGVTLSVNIVISFPAR